MSSFRILDENYLFDSATLISGLSEDSAFPASNLSRYFRSKVYRSSGYFKITTANQWIDWKDTSGGTVRSAAVPAGTYSPAALATQIAASMGLVGDNVYTATYSTATGRWTIASSGTYLSILFSSGTNAGSSIGSTIGFSAGTDQTGALTYTSPAIAIHTEEAVILDLGQPVAIDSFAMLFEPEAGHKFTNSAVIKLQANATKDFSAPSVNLTLSFDDTYETFTQFFTSDQTYRFWRISIVDPSNPWLYVEVPKVLICKATTLADNPQIGFGLTLNDLSSVQKNAYGNRYSDEYPSQRTMKFDYQYLSDADVETLYKIYAKLGGVVPLACAADPLGSVFDKDRFFIYGYLRQSNDITNSFYTFFDTALQVEEGF
jgi:hypothetical protein